MFSLSRCPHFRMSGVSPIASIPPIVSIPGNPAIVRVDKIMLHLGQPKMFCSSRCPHFRMSGVPLYTVAGKGSFS